MVAKRNFLMIAVVFTVVFIGCFGLSVVVKGAPIEMSVAHDDRPGGTEDKAMVLFAEVIEKLTDGEIKPKVYNSASLGGEKEIAEGIKMGTIQSGNFTTAMLANWVSEMGLCDLPYAFRSEEHVQSSLNGPLGVYLEKKAEDKGWTVVGYYYQSFRNIVATKPVKTLADLKGLRLRTMQTPIHMKAYSALGINCTPMAMSEVYMALKTGLVDAMESPLTFWWEKKMYEVANQYSYTGVFYCPNAIVMQRKWFDSLTPKQQLAIRIAGQKSSDAYTKFRDDDMTKYIKEAEAKGVKFYKIDTEPLAKICAPIQHEFAEKAAGKDGLMVMDLIEKLAKIN